MLTSRYGNSNILDTSHIRVLHTDKPKGANPNAESLNEGPSEKEKIDENAPVQKEDPSLRDPLKWFGMAAPSLRNTQIDFREIVIRHVPRLVNLEKQLQEIEIEVRRTRKRITKLH